MNIYVFFYKKRFYRFGVNFVQLSTLPVRLEFWDKKRAWDGISAPAILAMFGFLMLHLLRRCRLKPSKNLSIVNGVRLLPDSLLANSVTL